MKKEKIAILQSILESTRAPGTFRALIIGFIFPEFASICGDLAELSTIVENEPEPINSP